MRQKHKKKEENKKKSVGGNEQPEDGETVTESTEVLGYLVKVTVPHQIILVLQRVLEQSPYDGLQFRVRGQQVGAEGL